MTTLGITFTHDGTITILKDGAHVFSLAEERVTRLKSYIGFPFKALRYCITEGILDPKDITVVAVAAGTFKKEWAKIFALKLVEDKLYYDFQNERPPANFHMNDAEWQSITSDEECERYVKEKLREILSAEGIEAPMEFYDHHLCHAASAYYAGGFSEALAITIDAEGDEKSASINVCRDGRIETIHSMPVKASMGWLYSAITTMCGFKVARHEGKITGLAAYGDPTKNAAYFEKEVLFREGSFYFPRSTKLANIVMRVKAKLGVAPYFVDFWRDIVGSAPAQSREDLAAGVQYILERRVEDLVQYWVERTGIHTVVAAGGVFANVKMNQAVASLPSVHTFFVFPDMSDGGIAYGAAVLSYYSKHPFDASRARIGNAYLGPEYSNEDIKKILDLHPGLHVVHSEHIAHDAAHLIADKKIVGWFQGRMEYGPRALGNRSILADPTDRSINDWLNKRMRRTEFMPFAPSCLVECADDVFIIEKASMKRPAEFMTITFDVRKEWQSKIAAVTHVDGTARPQLVSAEINPKYHALLTEYRKRTGLPLCINTSFNAHEEPIVMSPEDAIGALHDNVVDVLAIGDFIVTPEGKDGHA